MALLSKILLPVVFSPQRRAATRYAEALALHFHAELLVLHVVQPLLATCAPWESMAYTSLGDLDSARVEEAEARLRDLAQEFHAGAIPVASAVVRGDPALEIVRYAHHHHADLIVMPTHGHGPFRRLLLGSVTAKVLHDADCPVWTGPHLEEDPPTESVHFRRIACALDLGPESRTVLGWAGRFAREYGAHLTIVHILPSAPAHLERFYVDRGQRAQLTESARLRIGAIRQETSIPGDVVVEAGDVVQGVSEAAAMLGAELLVIGRGRQAGVLGRLHATAYAILRESACPVAAV